LRFALVARLLAFPFARTLRASYCSMVGDLPNGPTELYSFNGHLLELASDRDVPLYRQVYALVRRVEREGVAPDLRWLDELSAPTSPSV
jgi:ketopantoate reductase